MEEKVRQRQAQFELREWTLGQILDHTVSRFPDREALVYADRDYRQTWREFGDMVDRFAKGLMAMGIQKGEKVAVWATNVPYWVALQFATAKIGAILITVNTNYREHELRYLLTHSECENIFLIDSVRDPVPHRARTARTGPTVLCVQQPAAPEARMLSGHGKAPGHVFRTGNTLPVGHGG